MRRKIIAFALIFLSGFLLMLSFNFYSDWKYEEEFVGHLTEEIKEKCPTGELVCLVDTTLLYTHTVLDPMRKIFGNRNFSSPKQLFTRHSFSSFYFGKGACGAYASFFCRVMNQIGYRSKFVIMDTKKGKGAHIIICIESDNKLWLVDPYFGHPFKDSNGHLSEIQTVADNWGYYSQFVPENYDPSYDYQYGWHYTNWQKMGGLSRVLYKAMALFMSREKLDALSLRYYLTRMGKVSAIIPFIGFLVCIGLAFRYLLPRKKKRGTAAEKMQELVS